LSGRRLGEIRSASKGQLGLRSGPFKNRDHADERHENNACGKFMSPETGLIQLRGAASCLIGNGGNGLRGCPFVLFG
jgi:hypothetical protein